MISYCLAGFWLDFGKLGPIQEYMAIATCRPSGRNVTTRVVESVLQVAMCNGILTWCVRVKGVDCVKGSEGAG